MPAGSAVFLSNLPEAAGATSGLSASGYVVFGDLSTDWVAFVLAFAGGAILTMLADTMMPEALEQSGTLAGILTSIGFALALAVSALE